jgi:hypothetical protein
MASTVKCVCVAWCLIPASQVSHRLGLRYSILDPGAGVELAVETQMLLEHWKQQKLTNRN